MMRPIGLPALARCALDGTLRTSTSNRCSLSCSSRCFQRCPACSCSWNTATTRSGRWWRLHYNISCTRLVKWTPRVPASPALPAFGTGHRAVRHLSCNGRLPPRPAKATMPGESHHARRKPPRPCPCPCPARALRKPVAHKPGESHQQQECTQDPVPRCSTRDQPRGRKDSPGRPRPPLPRQPKPGRQQWPPFDETGKFLSPLISHHQQQYHRVYARNWACPVALRGAQR